MTAYKIGKTGMTIAAAAAVAMCVVTLFQREPFIPAGETGLSLPPPSQWVGSDFLSWLLNFVLLGLCATGAWLLNTTYNFIRSTQPVLPAVFVVVCASNPAITDGLSSSLILCGVNIICLWFLFGSYDSRNATQTLFTVATFVSLGTMFEYAFLPMAIVYIIAAFSMKAMRIKEFCAFILGLLSPWWIVLGIGLISIHDLRIPAPFLIFDDPTRAEESFLLMVAAGLAIFISIFFGAADAMRIYAGNSQVNAMNGVIYWLGIICVACMIFDFANMFAYLATLYFCMSVQIANFCALRQLRHEWLVVFIPSVFFIILFILMIIKP